MKNIVAIVIPSYKDNLFPSDLLSLKHLNTYLSKYDKFFVVPKHIDVSRYKQKNIKSIKFEDKFFISKQSYNDLLLREEFYSKFKNYRYILIYQLDAIVFSDQLIKFCDQNYDYIAAPWFNSIIGNLSHKTGSPASGGNGGFSLRKVDSALKVLSLVNKRAKRSTNKNIIKKIWFMKAILTGKSHKSWLESYANNYPFNEDGFWSLEAPKYLKSYRVAPFKKALEFAFEKFPRKCFKLNGEKLPFGVHAWEKYDADFWTKYLLK